MALKRICDVTGDDGAEASTISVNHPLVGYLRWKLDMAPTAVKLLEEALAPFTERAELVTADDPEAEELSPPAPARPAKPARSVRPARDVDDDQGDDLPETTAPERKAARAWAQRPVNWKACGLDQAPSKFGPVEKAVIVGWVAAGRPMPA